MDWSLQNQDSVAGNLQSDSPEFSSKKHASLDDLFASHATDVGDMGLEWLSTFVEDCLSSTGSCLLPTQVQPAKNFQTTSPPPPPPPATAAKQKQADHHKVEKTTSFFLQRIEIPGKARSKRKRRPASSSSSSSSSSVLKTAAAARTQFSCSWFHQDQSFSDPPLLQQAYWLADSELIVNPGGNDESIIKTSKNQEQLSEAVVGVDTSSNGQQQRRCSHCLAQRTPQWRAGPLGPKTLCNACGVRYKSGRLLPEYRPAKSPTFVSYKHSNSHKKVMEMRMALLQSNS